MFHKSFQFFLFLMNQSVGILYNDLSLVRDNYFKEGQI